MSKPGRNDPCPCGSGRKYKHCCRMEETTAADELREILEDEEAAGRQDGEHDVERSVRQWQHARNHRALDDFLGLSPEQVHALLYFPFESPKILTFEFAPEEAFRTPLYWLSSRLFDAIGEQGLKPTATGNLPRALVQQLHAEYPFINQIEVLGLRSRKPMSEPDFPELERARVVCEVAGIIRKYRGRLILSREARRQLADGGAAALYSRLATTYLREFNWAYTDRYPSARIVQMGFGFSLWMLTLQGQTWQTAQHYAEAFLRAFPAGLQEFEAEYPVASNDPNPGETLRKTYLHCYFNRTLRTAFRDLGWIEMEWDPRGWRLEHCRVRATDLLGRTVRFAPGLGGAPRGRRH